MPNQQLDMQQIRSRFDEAAQTIEQRIAERLMRYVEDGWSAQPPSQAGDPPAVATGNLAASITQSRDSQSGTRVGTDLSYGRVLEYGSTRVAARPWLRPATEKTRADIPNIVRDAMQSTTSGNAQSAQVNSNNQPSNAASPDEPASDQKGETNDNLPT